LFDDFVEFLIKQQTTIIDEIESTIEQRSGARFCRDTWGYFDDNNNDNNNSRSGGITRVLQGGDCIEKGACSLTLIANGTLTPERAATIRARQSFVVVRNGGEPQDPPLQIRAGDTYSAAALSMVLHSKSPLVPTFRSDVRVFLVTNRETQESAAWFGESLC
jgi:coproporphyrinogen III oxidase